MTGVAWRLIGLRFRQTAFPAIWPAAPAAQAPRHGVTWALMRGVEACRGLSDAVQALAHLGAGQVGQLQAVAAPGRVRKGRAWVPPVG